MAHPSDHVPRAPIEQGLESPLKSAEQKLKDFFPAPGVNPQIQYNDSDLAQIAKLLRGIDRPSWATVPRTYTVLRTIGRLQLLEGFIDQGISDIWFPFTSSTLPPTLQPSMRGKFLELQSIVLTKSYNLENEERRHVNFGQNEPLPFEIKGKLGKGGYGAVDKVLSLLSHREFARKTFRKPRGLKKEDIQSFQTELQLLKRIRHEHCVELMGSYTDPKYFGILMSPVAECDLKTYYTLAADSSDRLSLLRGFFGCLANALQYLHHSKIRHRDIKPENILVKGDHVFLTDFGISFDFENLSRSTTTADSAKTWLYCAPEVAQYQKRNTSADVWSLGCVFLEMVTVLKGKTVTKMREYFTECNDNYRFYNNIDACRQWMSRLRVVSHSFDNVLLDWTTSMLSLEPESRPTAASIFYTIQGYRAQDGVEPASFCGNCCSQEGSTDGSDAGEDAWATDDISTMQISTGKHRQEASQDQPKEESEVLGLSSSSRIGSESSEGNWISHLREVVSERIRTLGEGHPDTLDSMHALNDSFEDVGQIKEALELREKILATSKQILGEEHPDTLDAMHNLAISYSEMGREKEAIELLEKTLRMRRQVLGEEHSDTLDTMHNLAYSYSEMDREKEALELQEKIVEIRRQVQSEEHPDTLDAMYNLAYSYSEMGRDKEGLELQEKTLAMSRQVRGEKHPKTLNAMYNLAYSYSKMGQDKKALELQEKTLATSKQILGEKHSKTLDAMHNLAYSYSKMGQDKEALELWKKTLATSKQVLGEEHSKTLDAMHNLAYSYSEMGQEKEALGLLEKIVTMRRQVLDKEHPETLRSMEYLANSYSKMGRAKEAQKLREEAQAARKRAPSTEHLNA